MAGSGPTDLHALAVEFLNMCEDALDTLPVGYDKAPTRSFISPGQPANDCCDQLSVYVAAVSEAPTEPGGLGAGKRHAHDFRVNHVTMVATITRCLDVDEIPPPTADLTSNAQQLNADGWALWNHVWNHVRAKTAFSSCREVFMDGLRSLVPAGGCGGWTLTLRFELEGYEEVIAP